MAGIDFRGKGFVYSAHLGLPIRSLKTVAKASLLPKGHSTENLVVAGNQLEALKALSVRFNAAVDIIYAVPPYNTGSDGWKYDDDVKSPITQEWLKAGLTGRDDPDRHDKWLSYMTPRLRLMHDLLANDGVLYVSIDDNEGHRLKMLLDEVFGEDNGLATLVWEKRYSVPSDVQDIGYVHENILVYRKSERFKTQLLPQTDEQIGRYKNPDEDERGPWKPADYTCRWSKTERPNLFYPIVNPHTGVKVLPKESRVWAYSKAETAKNVADGLLWWGKSGKNTVPALKNFVDTIQDGMVPGSLLGHEDVGHTDMAAKELRELLPTAKKDGKPLSLVRRLLEIAGKPVGTVLFPFPGAGEGPHTIACCNLASSDDKVIDRKFIVLAPDLESQKIVTGRLRALAKTGVKVTFEYCELGDAMDGDSLLRTQKLPIFDEVARHVFRSGTRKALPKKTAASSVWLIGSDGDLDVHLIYEPSKDFLRSDAAILDSVKLNSIVLARKRGRRSVVFAAGKYVPLSDLLVANVEFCAFPTAVYQAISK